MHLSKYRKQVTPKSWFGTYEGAFFVLKKKEVDRNEFGVKKHGRITFDP